MEPARVQPRVQRTYHKRKPNVHTRTAAKKQQLKIIFYLLNRRVREQASIALRNISKNPDRASAFSALSQVTVGKVASQDELSQHSDSSGIFSSSEDNLQRQSWSHLPGTSNHLISADRDSGSKTKRTISELTSLLMLVFENDALWRNGSERQFISKTSNSNNLGSVRLRKINTFTGKEKYLRSLQVLTNCLMVMSNVILISEEVDDRSGRESVEERYVSLVQVVPFGHHYHHYHCHCLCRYNHYQFQ